MKKDYVKPLLEDTVITAMESMLNTSEPIEDEGGDAKKIFGDFNEDEYESLHI